MRKTIMAGRFARPPDFPARFTGLVAVVLGHIALEAGHAGHRVGAVPVLDEGGGSVGMVSNGGSRQEHVKACRVKKCVFCQIIAREIAADFVYEDDAVCAFLDNRPLFPGHVLVVPKVHRETLGDLEAGEIAAVFGLTQRISLALPKALDAEGSFVANNNVVSQSVPHLHVHVVPRKRKDGLKGFFWPRMPYRDAEHAREVSAAIARELQ